MEPLVELILELGARTKQAERTVKTQEARIKELEVKVAELEAKLKGPQMRTDKPASLHAAGSV